VSKVLEKDDHESSVLGALIRSGNWLVPELAAQHLVVDLEDTAGHTSGGQQSQVRQGVIPQLAACCAVLCCAVLCRAEAVAWPCGSSVDTLSGEASAMPHIPKCMPCHGLLKGTACCPRPPKASGMPGLTRLTADHAMPALLCAAPKGDHAMPCLCV
jgi:hypothetical protein